MATRIPSGVPTMRRAPRQARSRATVQALLQAGARVLGERGWAGFTTNEVAATAGVSIGSLYQYFPDKQALTEAIRQRHLDDVLAVFGQLGTGEVPQRQRVTQLVEGMIAAHSLQPALHRVLLDEAPSDSGSRAVQALFEARYLAHYRALLAASPGSRGKVTDDMVVQVLSSAVAGVIHDAARRGTLTSPALKSELVQMVCAYLAP